MYKRAHGYGGMAKVLEPLYSAFKKDLYWERGGYTPLNPDYLFFKRKHPRLASLLSERQAMAESAQNLGEVPALYADTFLKTRGPGPGPGTNLLFGELLPGGGNSSARKYLAGSLLHDTPDYDMARRVAKTLVDRGGGFAYKQALDNTDSMLRGIVNGSSGKPADVSVDSGTLLRRLWSSFRNSHPMSEGKLGRLYNI
ncbi:MAG: hypothetical protein MJZ17_05095 [Bacteroidales bacterium]|nr:hypothetical protein [Bacteroidales bacterium]